MSEYPGCTRTYVTLAHARPARNGVPALVGVDVADAENWTEFHVATAAELEAYAAYVAACVANPSSGPVHRGYIVV